MSPVSIARFTQELEHLKKQMEAGALKHGEYDQRLARMIGELRERKLEGERDDVRQALADLLKRGVITPSVQSHITKRLGLE
jgi:hypothetical protein